MAEQQNGDATAWEGELFRLLVENVRDYAIFVVDPEGQVRSWSHGAERMLGYREDEILGKPADLFFTPEDNRRDAPREEMRQALRTGRGEDDRWHVRKDGTRFWASGVLTPLWDEGGTLRGFAKIMRDRTEWWNAERARRAGEERFRTAFAHAAVGVAVTDAEGRFLEVNPAYCEITGYSPEELLSKDIASLTHPDDWTKNHATLTRMLAGGDRGFVIEKRYVRKDGGVVWVKNSVSVVRDEQGRPLRIIALVEDVTQRKGAEAAVAEQVRLAEYGRDVGLALSQSGTLSEMLARCAEACVRHLDGAFARIWTADEDGGALELQASAGIYTHTDGPHARIPVGRFKIGLIAGERQPHLTNAVIGDPRVPSQEWAEREGMVAFAGYPLVVGDRLVGVLAMFARHALSGATLRAMASVSDGIAVGIERKRAEERLHREREWLRVTLASIGDAVIATGVDGRVTFLNNVAEGLTGWSRHEAEGRPLSEVFRIVNERTRLEVESPALRALREGAVVGLANHTVLIARDGTERAIDDSAAPIRDEAGAIMGAVLIFRDVDERRRAERDLEASEARKAAILQTALDAIVTIDHEGKVVEFNPSAESMFGHARAEAVGREMCGLIVPPSLRDAHRRGMARYLATGEGPVLGRRVEITAIRADGTEFPVELAIARISSDGPASFTAHIRDITDRRAAERALREGEERFRQLADAVPQLVWVTRPDRSVEYVNRRWLDYTGQAEGECLGPEGWASVVHPDDLGRVNEASIRSHATGEPFEAEYRLRDRGGAYRWHLGRALPVRGEDGRLLRRYGTATDIDDRKRAEQTARFLAEASDALAGLVDYEETLGRVAGMAVPAFADWCAVDMRDDSGGLRRVAVTHADPEKLRLAHELFAKYPPRPDDPHGIMNVLRTGEPEHGEVVTDELLASTAHDDEHLRLIGSLGLKSYICVPLRPRGGTPGVLSFITAESGRRYDADALRVAEDLARRATVAIENSELYRALREADRSKGELLASLRDSEQRFRTMAESIPQLAWMARPDGHIYWYNKRWHDYTGTTPEQMEGWGWKMVHDPEVLPAVMERWTGSIASGEPFDMVFPLKGADGQFRPFLTRVMPVRGEDGQVAHWFGTNTDIADRQRIEEELRAAKEDAEAANRAKSQFLAVLSHELRTPLNPILLAATSMLERPADPEEVRPTLEMIRQNVNLQARLIDDLLDVMRIVRGKMPLHWEVADCHGLIRQSLQMCQSEVFGKELRLELDLGAREHFLNADPARFQQVIWNLVKNAVKFTPGGGRITIRTRNPEGEGGGLVAVEISDTGIGIEPEVLPLIFDPFQQGESQITRKFGGLGLGLAICRGIVEAHGGTLAAESAGGGRGTTFRIVLKTIPSPAAADAEPAGTAVGTEPATPSSRRILVVEDEPATLRLMARLLRGLGHSVTTANSIASGYEAVQSGEFDLIVSDIGLPDGTGLDLMRRVVALRGRIASIALTGYGMEDDILRSREAGFTAHMTKPIDFTKLEAMIRQVASGNGPGGPLRAGAGRAMSPDPTTDHDPGPDRKRR